MSFSPSGRKLSSTQKQFNLDNTGFVLYFGGPLAPFFFRFPRPPLVAIVDGLFFHHTPADDKGSHRVPPERRSIRLTGS